ncbi:hypothetical protein Forpe1208_v010118 [Fusarium oxysporum f. sp. rapae]|uniref:Uncharacterized protein n=1 Tax=Fusarium oxysporum f. sp. rapae TaxID=485398 RepID=A0A8J5U5L9_FUSOX|nr:hypothetical protein Forpe1208_v010118 [Fusarium oxysporum f. sp. rapae]
MSTFRKKLKVLTGPLNKRYGRGVEMVIDSALGARLMGVGKDTYIRCNTTQLLMNNLILREGNIRYLD